MKAYEASARIKAKPEVVWAVLTDAARYPDWDSGIRVEGDLTDKLEQGQKFKLVSEVNPKRAFSLTVSGLEPGKSMVWTGGMPLRLFRGVRTFSLFPAARGSTRFTMREELSGPLLPLIGRSMPDLNPSFERFANGLKRRVERGK